MQRQGKCVKEIENMLTENAQTKSREICMSKQLRATEKERDFYFGKLRDIELLLSDNLRGMDYQMKAVQKILFAKEDENIEVDEEGYIIVWAVIYLYISILYAYKCF